MLLHLFESLQCPPQSPIKLTIIYYCVCTTLMFLPADCYAPRPARCDLRALCWTLLAVTFELLFSGYCLSRPCDVLTSILRRGSACCISTNYTLRTVLHWLSTDRQIRPMDPLELCDTLLMSDNISVLCWKVCGLNAAARCLTVHKTLIITHAHVVCLQETKLQQIDRPLALFLGAYRFDNFCYKPA